MRKLTTLCFLIFVFFCSVTPIWGQDEDEEYEGSPSANWSINVDLRGKATTTVSLNGRGLTSDASAVKADLLAGLRSALRCTPEKVKFESSSYGYSLSAVCQLPIHRSDLDAGCLIEPNPMLQRIRKIGAEELSISIVVPRLGYNHGLEARKGANYGPTVFQHVDVPKEQQAINAIRVEFGYSSGDVVGKTTVLALVLVAPLLLILWCRKNALSLAGRDKTASWFGYWRVHRWCLEGVWLIWIILLVSLDIEKFVRFASDFDSPVLYIMVLFVPPTCVSLLCQYMARPVWLKVRGIDLSGRETIWKGLWEHAAAALPMALILMGVMLLSEKPGTAMLCFAIAVVAKLFCGWMHGKVSGCTPRTLHGGELKERVMELAQRAGVKINMVSVMPAQFNQMGNAYALSGGNVMVTDYLLERLTRKETDSVMAHEIGHVKHKHTLLLSVFGFLVMFLLIETVLRFAMALLPGFLYSSLASLDTAMEVKGWIEAYMLYPMSLLLASLLRYFISRRCERSADEFATLATGEPESMITALVKLSKMNLMPLQWGKVDERLGTHPSTLRRVEAIAHRHRIPKQRLLELLEMQSDARDTYTVPDEVSNSDLVFSTELKTKNALLISLFLTLIITTCPLLLGYVIETAKLPRSAYWSGVILTPLCYLIFANFTGVLGAVKVKHKLVDKLKRAGVDLSGGDVHFIGIAPEEWPRGYDNQTVWDVGFLVLGANALHYHGDKISFAIPRSSITSVSKGVQYPGWFRVSETYVRWTEGEGEQVFHLHSLDGTSMVSVARKSASLLIALMQWRNNPAGNKPLDMELKLALPEFPGIRGNRPGHSVTVKSFATSVIFAGFLVFGLSSLVGLSDSISWYGAGLSAWCLLFANVPAKRYKDDEQSPRVIPRGTKGSPPGGPASVAIAMPEPSQVITCPECGLTKDVPNGRIPEGHVKVTCPRCRSSFNFLGAVTQLATAPQPVGTPDRA